MTELSEIINEYQNTLEGNNQIWCDFSRRVNDLPVLKKHRDFIEEHEMGFGDRAFHFLWYLLLDDLHKKFGKLNLLEIGVYKGQVISLWALLCKELQIESRIHAVTPLKGSLPNNKLLHNKIIKKFRKAKNQGNLYPNVDYKKLIRSLFQNFELDMSKIIFYEGYSNESWIIDMVSEHTFEVVYVDGDHNYEAVLQDIKNYSTLISRGGYLVMDDASFFLEGTVFWKGYEDVSKACDVITDLGFENVLNVGHNRLYRKTSEL